MRVLELADRLKLDVAPVLREVEKSEQAVVAVDSGLYPFQVDGVDFLHKSAKSLLGDEMGLGKTIQALMAMHPDEPVLCVVPAVVKHNWKEECVIWRKDLTPVVISGRKNFRLPKQGEVLLCNYELLPAWLEGKKVTEGGKKRIVYHHYTAKQKAELAQITLVVDEAHKVKNYKTQRAKRISGLSTHCKRTWALTGTPLLNRPLDLWGVLSSLNMQWEVFKSFSHFVECFNGYKGRFGYEFASECKPIVPELLRRVMLRRKRAEVLPDLPTKTYTTMVVDIQGRALVKKLNDMMEHCSIEETAETIEDILKDVKKLEQAAQRPLPPFELFSEIRADLAENRIPAVLDYAEECEEQDVPLVVFCAHVDPVRELGKRDGWECITGTTPARKRQEYVRRFQAGELKGLACTIIAAGVGLTLTRAWKALFVDLDWTPANNWQAEDRICRISQTSNVCEIVRMVSNHVLEQHVHILLHSKIRLIESAIERAIEVDPKVVESDGETEEEFKARMERASALKDSLATKSERELAKEIAAHDAFMADVDDVPEYADIPF